MQRWIEHSSNTIIINPAVLGTGEDGRGRRLEGESVGED